MQAGGGTCSEDEHEDEDEDARVHAREQDSKAVVCCWARRRMPLQSGLMGNMLITC